MSSEEKTRQRLIAMYSGKPFNTKVHEYQCDMCHLGFFVVEDYPRYVGEKNWEVCPRCYKLYNKGETQ
jgi:hypothetical protein